MKKCKIHHMMAVQDEISCYFSAKHKIAQGLVAWSNCVHKGISLYLPRGKVAKRLLLQQRAFELKDEKDLGE